MNIDNFIEKTNKIKKQRDNLKKFITYDKLFNLHINYLKQYKEITTDENEIEKINKLLSSYQLGPPQFLDILIDNGKIVTKGGKQVYTDPFGNKCYADGSIIEF